MQQCADSFRPVRVYAYSAALKVGWECQRLARPDALVVKPNPLEVIGNEDVGLKLAIAPHLIGLDDLVEIGADFLDLDIAKDHAAPVNLEVGRA